MGYISRVKEWNAGEILYAADLNAEIDNCIDSQIPEPSGIQQGDVLFRGQNAWQRLAYGTSGQFLQTKGANANPEWATSLDNPMTTQGDMLYGGTSGVASRLAKGSAYQFLRVNSGATAPEWSTSFLYTTSIADHGYVAIESITGTAGENLNIFETCYLKSDGYYWKADASAEATAKGELVMATASISASASGTFLKKGYIRDDSTDEWDGTLASGDEMWISETSGNITDTKPTTPTAIVRLVGVMKSSTILYFNPSGVYLELS